MGATKQVGVMTEWTPKTRQHQQEKHDRNIQHEVDQAEERLSSSEHHSEDETKKFTCHYKSFKQTI